MSNEFDMFVNLSLIDLIKGMPADDLLEFAVELSWLNDNSSEQFMLTFLERMRANFMMPWREAFDTSVSEAQQECLQR